MPLRWMPYLWEVPPVVPEEMLERLERTWEVSLPEEYKQLVRKYQGMAPEPCAFNVGSGKDVFNTLLTPAIIPGREEYSISKVCEVLHPYVPEGIHPFANTPGGEYLCFDYRAAPANPRVVLVTVEMSLYPIANDFRAFLEGLHETPEAEA